MTTALEFLGRRWNGAVLVALGRGAERFSEVLRMTPGLSDRMLAVRMKQLEQAGAVERIVVPSIPVQVRYQLTEHGRALLDAVRPLVEVGHRMELMEAETRASANAG